METGTKTHSRVGTLDLVISSSTISHQNTECYVEPRLHTTSDHETVLTWLEVQETKANRSTVVKFRLEKMDEKQFCTSLEAQKDLVRNSLRQAEAALVGLENGREALDQFAQKVTAAIHSSLELSTERTKNSEKGEAWWNDECREALAAMRRIQKHQLLDSAAGIENPSVVEVLKMPE